MRLEAAKLARRLARALFAEIAGDGGDQFLDRHRGAPQPKARRHRRERCRHERSACMRSIALGRPGQRAADKQRDIGKQAEHHAVHQRRQVEPEQSLRAQPRDTERAVAHDVLADHAGVGNARQKQRIGPHQNAGGHAGNGAERRAARARPVRRKTPASIGRWRRTKGARWRRAAPGRPNGSRCRRGTGSRRSRAAAPSGAARRHRPARRPRQRGG